MRLSSLSCAFPSPHTFSRHLPGGKEEMSLGAEHLALCSVESRGRAMRLRRRCRPVQRHVGMHPPGFAEGWRCWLACLEGSPLSSTTSAVSEGGIAAAHIDDRIYLCLQQSHLGDKCRERKAIHKA